MSAEIDPNPSAESVLAAAAEAVAEKPGGRVFIYVDHGPNSEPAVFASGDDETAADLLLAVGEWLEAPYDGDEDDDA